MSERVVVRRKKVTTDVPVRLTARVFYRKRYNRNLGVWQFRTHALSVEWSPSSGAHSYNDVVFHTTRGNVIRLGKLSNAELVWLPSSMTQWGKRHRDKLYGVLDGPLWMNAEVNFTSLYRS